MKRSEFLGLEFDWFATDTVGAVALMSSAGYGSIPDFVFEHFDSQQAVAQRFAALSGLPEGSDLIRVAQALAILGIFTYDWQHWDGPYRRIALPARPANVSALGLEPQLLAALVHLPDLQFATLPDFEPQMLLPCTA